jgi:hypothetical protein
MKPATTLQIEWDNEVGGVLIILLDPTVTIVDDIEDDEEEDEGEVGPDCFEPDVCA